MHVESYIKTSTSRQSWGLKTYTLIFLFDKIQGLSSLKKKKKRCLDVIL